MAKQGPIHRVVFPRNNRQQTSNELIFFAEGGLIVWIDEGTGDYSVVLPDEWEQRARAIARQIGRLKHDQTMADSFMERQLIREMIKSVAEAKAQGDPSDPRVAAYRYRHRRNTHVSFTGEPQLPPLPQPTGKRSPRPLTLPDTPQPRRKLLLPADSL